MDIGAAWLQSLDHTGSITGQVPEPCPVGRSEAGTVLQRNGTLDGPVSISQGCKGKSLYSQREHEAKVQRQERVGETRLEKMVQAHRCSQVIWILV